MEQKVKKRTWVKDAAIVFLAIMLVLTFFSNTILNRTLPEAATARTAWFAVRRGSATCTTAEPEESATAWTRAPAVVTQTGSPGASGSTDTCVRVPAER